MSKRVNPTQYSSSESSSDSNQFCVDSVESCRYQRALEEDIEEVANLVSAHLADSRGKRRTPDTNTSSSSDSNSDQEPDWLQARRYQQALEEDIDEIANLVSANLGQSSSKRQRLDPDTNSSETNHSRHLSSLLGTQNEAGTSNPARSQTQDSSRHIPAHGSNTLPNTRPQQGGNIQNPPTQHQEPQASTSRPTSSKAIFRVHDVKSLPLDTTEDSVDESTANG